MGEINDIEELYYGIKKINDWYASDSKKLSIVTIPYNSTLIFSDIILKVIKNNKRVLYIWNGRGIKQKLISHIKTISKNIQYSYYTHRSSKDDIVFMNYKDINSIQGFYDLVIYDDISYYSTLNSSNLNIVYRDLINRFPKVVLYSIEGAEVENEFYLGPLATENPFVEPRIINTRVDLNEDIPNILYEYLNWFKEENKNVVLFVPREENIDYIYSLK